MALGRVRRLIVVLVATGIVVAIAISAFIARPSSQIIVPRLNGPLIVARMEGRGDRFRFTVSLFAVSPDGRGRRSLMMSDSEFPASLSPLPDGRHLLFVKAARHLSLDRIFDLDAATGQVHEVLHCARCDFQAVAISPDGRTVAFLSGLNLFSMRLDGTHRRVLVKCFPPTGRRPQDCYSIGGLGWSPDGSRLVFADMRRSNYDGRLFVINADGSGLHQITECRSELCKGGERDSSPAWSPDGRSILFLRERNLYVVAPVGDGLQRISSCPYVLAGRLATSCWITSARWSPDGRKIAFAMYSGGVHITNADGSGDFVVAPEATSVESWLFAD